MEVDISSLSYIASIFMVSIPGHIMFFDFAVSKIFMARSLVRGI